MIDFNELTVSFGYTAADGIVAIRSSVDGFAANIDGTRALTGSSKNHTFDISSLSGASGSVELRVYVWTGGSGWRDLNSLNLNGRTISAAPLPPPGVAAQYTVNHHPRLQLGDAPLDGYAGSNLDQIAIL